MVEKVLFDTCILIDYLNGNPDARKVITDFPDRAISVITWMEVMAGSPDENDGLGETKHFLDAFPCIGIDEDTRELAAMLRYSKKFKLPDAVILATARTSHRLLVTRDKDLRMDGVYIPYEL